MKNYFVRALAFCLFAIPAFSAPHAATNLGANRLEEAISINIKKKPLPHYEQIWRLVEKDNGILLQAYLLDLAQKNELSPNDFLVGWWDIREKQKLEIGEHIYCHAARNKKMKAAKVLIDLGYVPEDFDWSVCIHSLEMDNFLRKASGPFTNKGGFTVAVAQRGGVSYWWRGIGTRVEAVNPSLACYALQKKQLFFTDAPYRVAVEGGCDADYISYRRNYLQFPKDYNSLTGTSLLKLAEVAPEHVDNADFQKALITHVQKGENEQHPTGNDPFIVPIIQDTPEVTKQLQNLIRPDAATPLVMSDEEQTQLRLQRVVKKYPSTFAEQSLAILKNTKNLEKSISALDESYKKWAWSFDGKEPAEDKKSYQEIRRVLVDEQKGRGKRAVQRAEDLWQAKLLEAFNGDKKLAAKMDKPLRAAYYDVFTKNNEEKGLVDFMFFPKGVSIKGSFCYDGWNYEGVRTKYEETFSAPVVVGYVRGVGDGWFDYDKLLYYYQPTVFTMGGNTKKLEGEGILTITDLSDGHGFDVISPTFSGKWRGEGYTGRSKSGAVIKPF